jgi:predicted HicB family RNase H-like nuclease
MKNIAFLIDEEFHKKIKLQSTKDNKSIKDYIIDLIKQDLEKKEGN